MSHHPTDDLVKDAPTVTTPHRGQADGPAEEARPGAAQAGAAGLRTFVAATPVQADVERAAPPVTLDGLSAYYGETRDRKSVV